jgi:hypothetical protein
MIKLPKYQMINGVHHELIKRTDKVALLSINRGSWYEVSRVYVWPKAYADNIRYPEREAISDSRQFYQDGSRTFRYEANALKYFDDLNKILADQMSK